MDVLLTRFTVFQVDVFTEKINNKKYDANQRNIAFQP